MQCCEAFMVMTVFVLIKMMCLSNPVARINVAMYISAEPQIQ